MNYCYYAFLFEECEPSGGISDCITGANSLDGLAEGIFLTFENNTNLYNGDNFTLQVSAFDFEDMKTIKTVNVIDQDTWSDEYYKNLTKEDIQVLLRDSFIPEKITMLELY